MSNQFPDDDDDMPRLDAGRLWAGGVATAVVAGLVAIVGILIARGIAHVMVFAPRGTGVWGNANTITYALVAALIALAATGLLHFMLVTTPRATQFFGWIMVLLTIVAVVVPLSVVSDRDEMVATAVLNLLIGLVITMLLISVAGAARSRRRDDSSSTTTSFPQGRGW
ncbi:MAG TPA: DUF6069 family protein [Pseudonocardiaceae bacterium]